MRGALPSLPYKSRGQLGLALVLLVCLSLYSLSLTVGITRDKVQEHGSLPGMEGVRNLLIGIDSGRNDVVLRFHAALRALQSETPSTSSSSGGGRNNTSSSREGGSEGTSSSYNSGSGASGSSSNSLMPASACPAELQVGLRPSQHTPALFGNQCEPWATRRAVLLLHMLLSPGMVGLEWGAGASTLWYLARISKLVTVEHNAAWAAKVRSLLELGYGASAIEERWQLQVAPPQPPEVLTFSEAESYDRFKAYVDVAFLERSASRPRFDFIAIDGQARLACFQRALWLLKSHGGVLMLNNAQRPALKEVHSLVPKRWLTFQESNPFAQTIVWVSCEAGLCGPREAAED